MDTWDTWCGAHPVSFNCAQQWSSRKLKPKPSLKSQNDNNLLRCNEFMALLCKWECLIIFHGRWAVLAQGTQKELHRPVIQNYYCYKLNVKWTTICALVDVNVHKFQSCWKIHFLHFATWKQLKRLLKRVSTSSMTREHTMRWYFKFRSIPVLI